MTSYLQCVAVIDFLGLVVVLAEDAVADICPASVSSSIVHPGNPSLDDIWSWDAARVVVLLGTWHAGLHFWVIGRHQHHHVAEQHPFNRIPLCICGK